MSAGTSTKAVVGVCVESGTPRALQGNRRVRSDGNGRDRLLTGGAVVDFVVPLALVATDDIFAVAAAVATVVVEMTGPDGVTGGQTMPSFFAASTCVERILVDKRASVPVKGAESCCPVCCCLGCRSAAPSCCLGWCCRDGWY